METDAKLENLASIANFIRNSMGEYDLNQRMIFQIQLAVDEACSNIILHGYPQKKGKIHIYCSKNDGKIFVVIEDWGKSWDPCKVKVPDLNADLEEREIGGLGVHLIKTFMDKVTYHKENGKNILTMIKSIKQKEPTI